MSDYEQVGVIFVLVSAILWLPFVFTAYVIGRRQFSGVALFLFFALERLSIVTLHFVSRL